LETSLGIGAVYFGDGGAIGTIVFLLYVIIVGIIRRTHQGVFGGGNAVINSVGFVMLIVKLHFVHHRLHHAFCVVGIVDGEIIGIANLVGFATQDAGEYTVECADIKVAGLVVA